MDEASGKTESHDWGFDSERYRRRSIRLRGFDYTRRGAYFVTICTRKGICLFGDVVKGEMRLNDLGRLAQLTWVEFPSHFRWVKTDAWIVMPNHVHGLIIITGREKGATHVSPLFRDP